MKTAAAFPLSRVWATYPDLVAALDAAPDQRDARLKLRTAVARTVAGVRCLFVSGRKARPAVAHVSLIGGGRRDFLILWRSRHGPSNRASKWWVRSLNMPGSPRELDLANPDHVAALDLLLAKIPVPDPDHVSDHGDE